MKITELKIRQEGQLIPEGLSVTETAAKYWIRYKIGNMITVIKILKSNGCIHDEKYIDLSKES